MFDPLNLLNERKEAQEPIGPFDVLYAQSLHQQSLVQNEWAQPKEKPF